MRPPCVEIIFISRSFTCGEPGTERQRTEQVVAAAYGPEGRPTIMIILGVILILIGVLAGINILYTIGAILAVIGVILWILGATGNAIGGRNHWF